jgi:hypothetical protein
MLDGAMSPNSDHSAPQPAEWRECRTSPAGAGPKGPASKNALILLFRRTIIGLRNSDLDTPNQLPAIATIWRQHPREPTWLSGSLAKGSDWYLLRE